jgi:trk system potassium uptake protein
VAMVAAVEGAIDVGHVVRLMALGRDFRAFGERGTTVATFTLPPASPLVGRRVGDLTMPSGSALVTVLRGNRLIVPEPGDVLRDGDEILFVCGPAGEERIEAMVTGS